MSGISEHITIPKAISSQNDLDFEYLRGLGQEYIKDLSRKLWTDYNIHDPGITVMELLCYAITDLGLRIDQPIEDMIASPENNFRNMHEQFKSAKNILTCKPVTAMDYRKLFVDIPGVKNCWITPHHLPLHIECNPDAPKIEFEPFSNSDFKTEQLTVKGLYDILVDFEKGESHDEAAIREQIHSVYHRHRNLCEDLVEVRAVPKQCIRVCAEIQLKNKADEEQVDAQIRWAIMQYLSPGVKVYSLQEMLDKSIPTDEIFQGPVLENGFITEDELTNSQLRQEVRLSDLINLIMKIDGVLLVEGISIDNCPPVEDDDSDCAKGIESGSDPWIICIQDNHLPVLCDQTVLSYKKGFIPVGIDRDRVQDILDEFEDEAFSNQDKSFEDLPMPLGRYSDLRYETMQHQLPENYGISPYGLSPSASNERKVQAKQLKGYLLFFDQILSTYFSHLEHIKQLLSNDETLQRTYFFKAVENIEGIEDLVKDHPKYQENVENLIGDMEDFKTRRNDLLDHLISRFAEVFEDYSSAMYKLYGRSVDSVENNILLSKNKFLKQYDIISSERGLAYNYTSEDIWDSTNVSGFQKRIALLSGISDYSRKDLFNKNLSIETLHVNPGTEDETVQFQWHIKSVDSTLLSSLHQFASRYEAIESLLKALRLGLDSGLFTLLTTANEKFYVGLKNREGEVIGIQSNHKFTVKENAESRLESTVNDLKAINYDEGFYLIENILTLPYKNQEIGDLNNCLTTCVDADCSGCSDLDPFSYQLTIVFPGYTSRFSDGDFRMYMESLIRSELPAHILPRICWVGHIDGAMVEIEKNDDGAATRFTISDSEDNYELLHVQNTWKAFLESKKRKANGFMASHKSAKDLLCAISELNTIYPNGKLHDCTDEDIEFDNKIILNRSALGSL